MNYAHQILVVDDDLEDHYIVKEYFNEAGYSNCVTFITNGKAAIDFLENLSNNDPIPKLIVLDLNMPILNGTQTLIQLKQMPRIKNIPIIIFSTSENENEKRKCLSLGAVNYLVKPTTFTDGEKMVAQFIEYLDVKIA
jgi:CheY-like chemotaxis protein